MAQIRQRTLLLAAFTLLPLAHALEFELFRTFLPFYERAFKLDWVGKCDEELKVRAGHIWCENITDCILNNTGETHKSNMAGASVLLGLLPSLLGQLSPSLGELSQLFDQRPVLAFLAAASNPGVFLNRLFSREEHSCSKNHDKISLWRPQRAHGQAVLSALEYVVLLANIANVYTMAVELGINTVVSWSCPNQFWVLGWTLGILPVVSVSLGLHFCTTRRVSGKKVVTTPGFAVRVWVAETAPCCARVQRQYETRGENAPWLRKLLLSVFMYLGPIFATLHWIVGTAILSSMLFVPFRDAVPLIFRWAISGCVARAVVEYELASFATVVKEEAKGDDSTVELLDRGVNAQVLVRSQGDSGGRVHGPTQC